MTSEYFLKNIMGRQHNILQFVFLLQVEIHMAYILRASIYHMSKKSGFHHQIWPKHVTHLHAITRFGFRVGIVQNVEILTRP